MSLVPLNGTGSAEKRFPFSHGETLWNPKTGNWLALAYREGIYLILTNVQSRTDLSL